MQTIGYIEVDGTIIKLLIRPSIRQNYNSVKIRESGNLGQHLTDEEIFLRENPIILASIRSGKVVKL